MAVEEIGTLLVRIKSDLSGLESGLNNAGNKVNNFSNKTEKISTTFKTVGAAATTMGVGLAATFGGAVKTAMDFDAQMSKVQALSGSTAAEFEKLRQTAIDLGASTSFSSSQAAEGMQMLAASGMDANKIIGAMPGVLSAAAASGEEMGLVAETMGNALNIFKLEATESTHVADVLTQVANQSSAGIQDMAYTMKYAGPVASQLGISMEELGAACIEMANSGIKGEQAGTTLRGALLRLVDPPKDASAKLKELGVAITDSSGKMNPLSNIIAQLKTGMEGMSEAEKAAALSTIFGTEATSGMLVLIGEGSEKFDAYTQSLKNSTGASAEAAKVMQNNLKGSMDQLSGSIESAAISLGTALTPTIRKVSEVVTNLVNKFNSLPESTQRIVAVSGAVAAALLLIAGPIMMLIGFIPSIAAGFTTIAGIFGGLGTATAAAGTATTGLGTALTAVAAPIAAVVAGIALVVVAIKQLWAENEGFRTSMIAAWNNIKQSLGDIATDMKAILDKIKGWWKDHGESITSGLKTVWDGIKTIVKGALEIIANIIGLALNVLTGDWKGAWDNIKEIFKGFWDAIKGIVETAWGLIKIVLGTIFKGFDEKFNSIKTRVLEIFGNLKTGIGTQLQETANWIAEKLNYIKGLFNFTLEIPRPKLPKWSIDYTNFKGVNIPTGFSFDGWYAKGGIFDNPSVIGVGESGSEAVVPIDRLSGLMADALRQVTGGNAGAQPALAGVGGVLITGNTFNVRNDQDIKKIAKELYNLQNNTARAKGVLLANG